MQVLPAETLYNILVRMLVRDVTSFSSISRFYRSLYYDQYLWKQLLLRDFTEHYPSALIPREGDYRTQYGWLSFRYRLAKKRLADPEYTCTQAAKDGDIVVMKELRKQGKTWDEGTFAAAALGGHLELMYYLYSEKCPWDVRTCNNAVLRGHYRILKFCARRECPWDTSTVASAVEGKNDRCIWYVCTEGCPLDKNAAEYAFYHYRELFWVLYETGAPMPWSILIEALLIVERERGGSEAGGRGH